MTSDLHKAVNDYLTARLDGLATDATVIELADKLAEVVITQRTRVGA